MLKSDSSNLKGCDFKMQSSLSQKVKPDHTALLVVDIQREYCTDEGVLAKLGFDITPIKEMIPRLADFIDRCRKVLPTIIFFKTKVLPELRTKTLIEHYTRVGLQRQYKPELVDFWKIHPSNTDIVIEKHRYSGFAETNIQSILRAKDIKAVIIVGVATNVCVESTARDAFSKDYQVIIVSDMTEGTTPAAKNASLKTLGDFFGEVINSKDLFLAWGMDVNN